jgi:gluconate 2-dehydrogenase gamma chain
VSLSRRDFVTTLAAAWAAAAVACRDAADPEMSAHGPPMDSPAPPRELRFLTTEEATEIEAVAARIIPSDETPGAREAGVVWFIDGALMTFAADAQGFARGGVQQLSTDVAKAHPGRDRFSALAETEQDEFLRTWDTQEFFGFLRFGTIAGMFALPKYGGNADWIGWELVGQERVYEFKPPFGWYDRPDNQRALLGRVL